MKEELIKLAGDKKFVSKFFNSKPYKHSVNENLRYFLWMSEIKKWLIDNYDILVVIEVYLNDIEGENDYYECTLTTDLCCENKNNLKYDSHELALEDGIFEALKLIK